MIIITSRPWRSLFFLFRPVFDFACDRQAFVYQHLRHFELGIVLPVEVFVVLGTAFDPGLVLVALSAEKHSFLFRNHVRLDGHPVSHFRLRVVHRDAKGLSVSPKLLVHDLVIVGEFARSSLLDRRVRDELHVATAGATRREAAF